MHKVMNMNLVWLMSLVIDEHDMLGLNPIFLCLDILTCLFESVL